MGKADPAAQDLDDAGSFCALQIAQGEVRDGCLQHGEGRMREHRNRQHGRVGPRIEVLQSQFDRI